MQSWTRASVQALGGWRTRDRSDTATNIRLLYWDIAWFGILFGVTGNFLVVFVARLDASPWLLSAVTSGPALINILWQLPALRIVERTADPRGLTVRSALPQRFGFLIIAVIPFFLPRQWQAYAIVAIILLQGLPTAVMAVAFSTMFNELVPRERVAAVVGMRNVLLGISSTAMVLACGVILTALPFPWGYQTILLLGFAASLGSVWAVSQLRTDSSRVLTARSGAPMPPSGSARSLLYDGNFVRFVSGAGILNLGMFMTAPLFPLYWVDTLHLGDGWISIFATVLSMTSILGAFGSRSFARRWRISAILGSGSILFGLYPALTSALSRPLLIAFAAGFAGIWGGVINVTLFNALAEVAPPAQRARYIGVYTWLMNIAIFAGPILGAALAGVIGVRTALLCAALVRFLAGAIFYRAPFAAWDRVPSFAAAPAANRHVPS